MSSGRTSQLEDDRQLLLIFSTIKRAFFFLKYFHKTKLCHNNVGSFSWRKLPSQKLYFLYHKLLIIIITGTAVDKHVLAALCE